MDKEDQIHVDWTKSDMYIISSNHTSTKYAKYTTMPPKRRALSSPRSCSVEIVELRVVLVAGCVVVVVHVDRGLILLVHEQIVAAVHVHILFFVLR